MQVSKILPTTISSLSLKRVAAYARVSTDKDTMQNSLAAQISYYNEYISTHPGWIYAGVYADDGISGTKDSRPEFQRLLADCRAGQIDAIITKSITRFARNTVILLSVIRELKELGIDVIFEKENMHSISPDGELLLTLLAMYAEEEARSVSENQKWRIQKMFAEGRPNNGNMLGYRLVDGKLELVPEEAEIVRRIYTDYLSGLGRNAIMKKLDSEGIPAPQGGRWSESTIMKILKNERYTGILLLQKTYNQDFRTKKKIYNKGEKKRYLVEDAHEAIISKELWDAVQAEIAKRSRAPKEVKTENLFTHFIRCEICGKYYRRKIAYSGKKSKPVWICTTFNSQGKAACSSQQIPEYILMSKTETVLESPKLTRELLESRLKEITIPEHNMIRYVFKDGHEELLSWQNPSRRESWTEEMREAARIKTQINNKRKEKQTCQE